MKQKIDISRRVACEDLQRGDYITVSAVTGQYISLDCDRVKDDTVRPVRAQIMPNWSGWPMKVLEICLPFVLVVDRDGDKLPLDVRRHQLVKVSEAYWQGFQKEEPKAGAASTGGKRKKAKKRQK